MPNEDEETILVTDQDVDETPRKISKHGDSFHISIQRRLVKKFLGLPDLMQRSMANAPEVYVGFRRENGKRVLIIEEIRKEVKEHEP